MVEKFWRTKSMAEMNQAEWESLCDGCGQCCLHKLDDGRETIFSNISCHMLDGQTCQCKDYQDRKKYVSDCVQLTPRKVKHIDWLPATCAYRLVDEGKDLFDWHYLVCGDKNKVHEAGISVRGRVVSEKEIKESLVRAMERPEHQLHVEKKKIISLLQKILG